MPMAVSSAKRITFFRHTPLELILGVIFTAGMVLLVVFSDAIFRGSADMMDLRARLLPPFVSLKHILGTDPLGRDVLARIAAGGKISLIVGLLSVGGATIVGTTAGLIAGYFRGVADMILMRIADVQLAMPFMLMALTFIAIVGPGLSVLISLMIIAQWVQYARLVRGQVLSLRDREFIQSARAIGAGKGRIIFKHILPNIIGPVIVLMTLNVANNILLESSLTFVGLGVDATIPSWGGMLADGRTYVQSAWWVSVFPGFAIMFTVLGLNLLGDWLRDYLDPTREK
ncbi:ABC transporter permease (plasmid) [Rhizobium jaguaris]|uniref:ABC transporter permease n=2 Tax=Rhizobium jaguaris TaxID=1312183 RepID=A0A387FX18_9HYPH|nr:ABC transporter permease [Rhizobium jaguaris]AYG62923.1 ABC transporter permease [Rhizobium jaguaris]